MVVLSSCAYTAPSGPPRNFDIDTDPDDPTTLVFSWAPPAPADRNGIITSYTLACDPTVDDLPVSLTTLTATIGGFEPFTVYECSVLASTSEGDGPAVTVMITTLEDGEYCSDYVCRVVINYYGIFTLLLVDVDFTLSPLLTLVPGPVSDITWIGLSNTSALVSWSEPETPNGEIEQYRIILTQYQSSAVILRVIVSGSELSIMLSDDTLG